MNQSGDYLIDCRFNKSDLIDRIRKIASRKKIFVCIKDALKLIEKIQKESENSNIIFILIHRIIIKLVLCI